MTRTRLALATFAAACVAGVVWFVAAWLCEARPLWTQAIPGQQRTSWIGFSKDGQILLRSFWWMNRDPSELEAIDARTGQVRWKWQRPEGRQAPSHMIAATGHLRLLLEPNRLPFGPTWLVSIDLASGQAREHQFPPNEAMSVCFSADGATCYRLRRQGQRLELVRCSLATEKEEQRWEFPDTPICSELATSADGRTAAWCEADTKERRDRRVMVADLVTGDVRHLPLDDAITGPCGLSFPGPSEWLCVELSGEPSWLFNRVRTWNLRTGKWLRSGDRIEFPTPVFGSGVGLAAWDSPVRNTFGETHRIVVWRHDAPELPRYVPMVDRNEGHLHGWLGDDRLALRVSRREQRPDWLAKALGCIGLGGAFSADTLHGIVVWNLRSDEREFVRLPMVGEGSWSEACLSTTGLLAMQHSEKDASFLEVWAYPPATWRTWLPPALVGALGLAAFLILARRRRTAQPAPKEEAA